MLSIEKCREILGDNKARGLTDEQIEKIRTVLMDLARINVKIIEEQNKKKK